MLKLVWRAKARAELRHIIGYIVERDVAAAARLEARIDFVAGRLVDFPYMHRVGRVPNTREAVAHANYILIYRVGLDEIVILNVKHAAQRYP